jgi:C4-dicarboxylate transporter DctQ subunit
MVNMAPPVAPRTGAVRAAVLPGLCLAAAEGRWDYWAPFANLPPTTGRWFPTGFEEISRAGLVRGAGHPDARFLRFLEDVDQ